MQTQLYVLLELHPFVCVFYVSCVFKAIMHKNDGAAREVEKTETREWGCSVGALQNLTKANSMTFETWRTLAFHLGVDSTNDALEKKNLFSTFSVADLHNNRRRAARPQGLQVFIAKAHPNLTLSRSAPRRKKWKFSGIKCALKSSQHLELLHTIYSRVAARQASEKGTLCIIYHTVRKFHSILCV